MKLILTIIIGVIFVAAFMLLAASYIYNFRSDRKPEAREFINGHMPEPPLNGPYKGNAFSGMGSNWLGKQFDANKNAGINNFRSKNGLNSEQRYPFITSIKPGLRNKTQIVLQLNYNLSDNPLWLRYIRDEVVEVSPGHYLGKIQLKISFVVVTLGYFRLSS